MVHWFHTGVLHFLLYTFTVWLIRTHDDNLGEKNKNMLAFSASTLYRYLPVNQIQWSWISIKSLNNLQSSPRRHLHAHASLQLHSSVKAEQQRPTLNDLTNVWRFDSTHLEEQGQWWKPQSVHCCARRYAASWKWLTHWRRLSLHFLWREAAD